ncbi:FeoB-associated Cys-rich membrane protein [Anaerocolumna sedimenticola]|uniref:FeoB-associated Cys-rich membrane protein n=1 Tax=Anaerocolumna sedimenticola TaxID=2696063 RepID=A0A6P1TKR3_9FIRM|nr:FeoB-associated Cys-rich membrane protein [Anaerocolumna sedimenticola]
MINYIIAATVTILVVSIIVRSVMSHKKGIQSGCNCSGCSGCGMEKKENT